MEQLKFEKDFSEKLNKREIEPKAGSWEELGARLNSEEKGKKPVFWWIGIAASIIGGILILSLVFNNLTPSDTPEIVDAPKEEVKLEITPVETSEEIVIPSKKVEEKVATSEINKEIITPRSNPILSPKRQMHQNNREAVVVIDNRRLLQQQTIRTSIEPATNKIFDQKLNDAINSVIVNVENGKTVTDAEVNMLLAEAANKLSEEHYKADFAVGKVNPQDLLQEVEFEMDDSFRNKLFEILKEGYLKAKTAVANRNY
jgi:hypothetical protein